jgi:hypothetical protein
METPTTVSEFHITCFPIWYLTLALLPDVIIPAILKAIRESEAVLGAAGRAVVPQYQRC